MCVAWEYPKSGFPGQNVKERDPFLCFLALIYYLFRGPLLFLAPSRPLRFPILKKRVILTGLSPYFPVRESSFDDNNISFRRPFSFLQLPSRNTYVSLYSRILSCISIDLSSVVFPVTRYLELVVRPWRATPSSPRTSTTNQP